MKKRNLKLRTFCFLFTLILIFSCLPIYAFEEENSVIPPDVLDSSIVSENVAVYDEPIDDNIIVNVTEPTEIVARRDRNVKHYRLYAELHEDGYVNIYDSETNENCSTVIARK